MRLKHTVFILLTFWLTQTAFSQEHTYGLSKEEISFTVPIEQIGADSKGTPIGTGFLVGHTNGLIALVTAKHVIWENGAVRPNLAYRLNNTSGQSDLIADSHAQLFAGKWFVSEQTDVAIRFIVFSNESKMGVIPMNALIERKNVRYGAPVYVLGYPMRLRSEKESIPILRKGVVAKLDEGVLWVDCFTFPGNSGGPVVYAPPIRVTGDLLKLNFRQDFGIIGLVSANLPYVDVAVSGQTQRPRVTFEENTGLTIAVSSDDILALLNRADVASSGKK